MTKTLFINANIFDGLSPTYRGAVVVEGDRIVSVNPAAQPVEAAPGDAIFDLQGRSIMPGLIAGHMHLAYRNLGGEPMMADLNKPAAYLAILAAKNAAELLDAGVTSGIGAGSLYNIDVTIKELVEAGEIPGPRIMTSGRELSTTGGPVDLKPHWWRLGVTGLGVICDGADEYRKVVRDETQRGVEIIKLFPEGGRGLGRAGPDMEFDEVQAAARTARARNVQIRAHCVTKACAKMCVEAGVGIIDHADEMDDELIDLFVASGTYVLPSLYCMHKMSTLESDPGIAGVMRGYIDQARQTLPKAVAAGVRFVAGDDYGLDGFPHSEFNRELTVYADVIGLDNSEALRWATVNAADMVGWSDVGRIQPGCYADLLVLSGDPTRDITVLHQPEGVLAVMKGGQFVRSSLQAASHEDSIKFTEPVPEIATVS